MRVTVDVSAIDEAAATLRRTADEAAHAGQELVLALGRIGVTSGAPSVAREAVEAQWRWSKAVGAADVVVGTFAGALTQASAAYGSTEEHNAHALRGAS